MTPREPASAVAAERPIVPRLRLTLAYDGTPWSGWQMLTQGGSVQDELNAALVKVTGGPVKTQGSGRTDAGVHALGQVVHAEVPDVDRLPPEAWVRAVNAHLPPSIRLLEVAVAPGFHARFDAVGKVYRYRIWRPKVMHPLEVDRAWHVFGPLDMDALRKGAVMLTGTHDFSRLTANRAGSAKLPDTRDPNFAVRTLSRVEVRETQGGDVVEIEFEGTGFLYKMVRLMVGTLVHIARGRETLDFLEDVLANPKAEPKSHQSAPAGGLYLVRVEYDEE